MLDAGPDSTWSPQHIFVTHTHLDHVISLPFLLLGSALRPDVYGPTKAEQFIKNHIGATVSLNAVSKINPDSMLTYHPMDPRTSLEIDANKTKLIVETFRCHHSVPTVGYGFSVVRDKLKKDYHGMEGRELKRRRLDGETITEPVATKKFAYVCDSTIAVVETNPSILEYPVIFIECTFLLKDELELTKKKKHIHWQHLKPYVRQFPNITFILIHFSQRYRDKEIVAFFRQPENCFANVLPWV